MTIDSLRHTALAGFMLAAMALAGCSSSSQGDEPQPVVDATDIPDMTLSLKVTYEGGHVSSRAAADKNEDFEPLSGDFEALTTLRVILLRSDGVTVEGNRMVNVEASGALTTDHLRFRVVSGELKYVYLIGNEATLTLPADIEDYSTVSDWLNSYRVNSKYTDLRTVMSEWTTGYAEADGDCWSLYSGDAAHLPMTEMFRLPTDLSRAVVIGGNPDDQDNPGGNMQALEYLQTSHLFITPAAAKATFRFHFDNKEGKGRSVTGISFIGPSQREYVFPNGAKYDKSKYIEDNEQDGINMVEGEKRYITEFNSPTSNATMTLSATQDTGFVPVPMISSDTEEAVVRGPIYFPESLSKMDKEAYKVQVQLDNKEWLTAPLIDNLLSIGGMEAIARDTHLYIDIHFTDKEITCNVQLVPYVRVDLNPGFGF